MKAATDREIGHELTIDISIHAAREGGDITEIALAGIKYISIHAARDGGDDYAKSFSRYVSAFQSTPPVKAAT